MNLTLITGMSGAGKSQAANALEDMGYYCVDNIPPLIIPAFVDIFSGRENDFNNLAIVTDIRGGELFNDIISVLGTLKERKVNCKILFLNCSDDVIVRRYKENRRKHPLCAAENLTVPQAVQKERALLSEIRKMADYVIDTSYLSTAQLKQQLSDLFLKDRKEGLEIECMSFGFKYGIPAEADLVFDVRCLPNPFYIENLRSKTGLDEEIRTFVMDSDDSRGYFERLKDFLDFNVPLYIKEGKSQLIIAFGCTGGKHRSVTFAELINKHLKSKGYYSITVHRDITKKQA